MANIKKTQLLTLSLIATLLSFTPLLSSSFRSTYLYFIINVLIVVLGAEAGFLSPSSSTTSSSSSSSSKTNLEADNKKSSTTSTSTTNARVVRVVEEDKHVTSIREKVKLEKSVSEKIVVCAKEVQKMIKKCPSTPSIFFIGGDEDEVEQKVEELIQGDEEENDNGEYDDNNNNHGNEDEEEELFVKAETFIVNFYKQLKMQREESWKKIHGFNKNSVLVN